MSGATDDSESAWWEGARTAAVPVAFSEPDGPTVESVRRIHRGQDGFIRFLVPQPGADRLRHVASAKPPELDGMLPTIRQQLLTDAYVTINGFYKGWTHKEEDLRYLNAVYTDLDAYGLTTGEAVGKAIDAQDSGVIPPASVIVRSGRGIWLLWLLHSRNNPNIPSAAYPGRGSNWRVLSYLDILRETNRRLRESWPELCPDRKAMDTTRLTRLEGSFNTAAGSRVAYWWQASEANRSYSYTLDRMLRFLDRPRKISHTWQPPAQGRAADRAAIAGGRPKRNKAKATGKAALWEKRLYEFKRIEVHRGGMPDGCRYHGALMLALALCKLHREKDLDRELYRYAADCRPSLSAGEVRKAIKGAHGLMAPRPGRSEAKYGARRVAEILEITTEEVEELARQGVELTTIHPTAPAFRDRPRPRKEAEAKRRAAVLEIAKGEPLAFWAEPLPGATTKNDRWRWPPGGCVREMERRLAARGIKTTTPTVSRDFKALALAGKLTRPQGSLLDDL